MGPNTAHPVGLPIELRPGDNEVDSDFWRAWLEQNKGSALLSVLAEQEPEKEQGT